MSLRVVLDTGVVVSALVFARGRLAWLCRHWGMGGSTFLVSRATVDELVRVLAYPKFQLSTDYRLELLSSYLPYCETVAVTHHCAVVCRDPNDQPLLDLAESGRADVLVTSDGDLLALKGQTPFAIESPEEYRQRFATEAKAT
jgi:putative PIN family toxin of toxin-antitoxin system